MGFDDIDLLFEWLDTSNWEHFLYKGNSDCFVIEKFNTGANQGTGFRWGSGWGDGLNGGSKADARSSRGSKILSITYSGSARSVEIYANGTHAATSPPLMEVTRWHLHPYHLPVPVQLLLVKIKGMENFSSSETPLAILIGKP